MGIPFLLALAACTTTLAPAPTLPPPFSGTGSLATARFYLAVTNYTVAWTARNPGTEPRQYKALLQEEPGGNPGGFSGTVADRTVNAGQSDSGTTDVSVEPNWYHLSVTASCEWTASFQISGAPS